MVCQFYCKRLARGLTILVTVLVAACSSNPAKETTPADSYADLYSGGSNKRTANEAAITAETPEEAIERGDEAYRKGQYDIALYEYVEALKLNGGDNETLNKVGDIHFTLDDMGHAGQAYQASLQLDDENQHALQGLGLIQIRTRNFDQAKINLQKVLGINPDLWHAHNGLGTIADIEGDYATAVVHYQRALQLNPQSAQIRNNLGYSEYLSGNWRAAMMRFVQAVNIDPNFDRAWYNIGLLYTRQGNYEDAYVAFRNVLDTPQAYNDIGYINMMDGYYDVAELYFDKAVKSSPSYYLKAHENIDKLERLRERKSSAGYYSRKPTVSPDNRLKSATEGDTYLSGADASVVALNEAGQPVVTVAEPQESVVVTSTPDGVAAATAMVITADVVSNQALPEPQKAESRKSGNFDSIEITKDTTPAVDAVSVEPASTPAPAPVPRQAAGEDLAPQPAVDKPPEPTEDSTAVNDTTESASTETSDSVSTQSGDNTAKASSPDTGSVSYNTKNEQSEYREALALVRDGEFEAAAESFEQFLKKYPGSSYADNASYWIGETYYVTRDFEPALQVFTGLVNEYPDSPKVPDTRLKIGYIHYEQSDWTAAQSVLSSIIESYPDTEVAQLANARLVRMEDEGH